MARKKRKKKNKRSENLRRKQERKWVKGLSRKEHKPNQDVVIVEEEKEEQPEPSQPVKSGLILNAGQITDREIQRMMKKYEIPGSKKTP